MTSRTILNCFNHLFSIFGMPDMAHSDRGPNFLSTETTNYLHSKGIATSRTSRYNPRCNGQVELCGKASKSHYIHVKWNHLNGKQFCQTQFIPLDPYFVQQQILLHMKDYSTSLENQQQGNLFLHG